VDGGGARYRSAPRGDPRAVRGPSRPTEEHALGADPAKTGAIGPCDRHHAFPGRDEQADRRVGDGCRLPRGGRQARHPGDGDHQCPDHERDGGQAEERNAIAVSGAEDDLAVHSAPSVRWPRSAAFSPYGVLDLRFGCRFFARSRRDWRDPPDPGQAGAGSASSAISEPATPRCRRRPISPRRITKSWFMTKISRTKGSGAIRFIHQRLVRIRQS